MGRHNGEGGDRRGAHRSEPVGDGTLAAVTHLLGTTVPKRVQPPRLLNVLLFSGVTLSLILFGYSTTQIYLRFNEPSGPAGGGPAPSASTAPGRAQGGPGESQNAGSPPGARHEGDTENTADGRKRATTVSYRTVESADGHFTGRVTITNTGDSALDDWVLDLGFRQATVTSAGDAEWRATDSGVIVRKPDESGGLAPGESTTVDLTVEGAGQAPNSCSLNGHSCGW